MWHAAKRFQCCEAKMLTLHGDRERIMALKSPMFIGKNKGIMVISEHSDVSQIVNMDIVYQYLLVNSHKGTNFLRTAQSIYINHWAFGVNAPEKQKNCNDNFQSSDQKA